LGSSGQQPRCGRDDLQFAPTCDHNQVHGGSFGYHILTIMMKQGYSAYFFGISMDEPNTDLIQGTLDMLILKALSLEPMHGFGIARRIEQISKGVFKVNPGSLLTAFQRLERVGWLDSEWRQTEN